MGSKGMVCVRARPERSQAGGRHARAVHLHTVLRQLQQGVGKKTACVPFILSQFCLHSEFPTLRSSLANYQNIFKTPSVIDWQFMRMRVFDSG